MRKGEGREGKKRRGGKEVKVENEEEKEEKVGNRKENARRPEKQRLRWRKKKK